MTVGELRKAIEGVPDELNVFLSVEEYLASSDGVRVSPGTPVMKGSYTFDVDPPLSNSDQFVEICQSLWE